MGTTIRIMFTVWGIYGLVLGITEDVAWIAGVGGFFFGMALLYFVNWVFATYRIEKR